MNSWAWSVKFAIVPVTVFFTGRLLKVLIIDLGIEKEKGKKEKWNVVEWLELRSVSGWHEQATSI